MKRYLQMMCLMLLTDLATGQGTIGNISYNVICTYQLTYHPDSTNLVPKKETFYLFIQDERSLFKSKNKYLQDSAMSVSGGNNSGNQNLISFLQQHRTDFDFSIEKSGCNDIKTTDKVYHNYYSYPETPNHIQWALQNDTANISGYSCRKATAEFGGRKWNAWFTEAIPVNEGPYKFCGLPGLIVRLADSKGHYDFLLSGLNQSPEAKSFAHSSKPANTNKATFYKQLSAYNANPIGTAEKSGVVFTSGRNEIKERVQQKIKANNNPIEFFKD